MYKKVIIYFTLMLSLFMLGCSRQANIKVNSSNVPSNSDNEKQSADRISELEDKINSYKSELKLIYSENDYYKNYINKLVSNLSDEELLKLAKDEWQYKLELDDKDIPEDGAVEVNKSNFRVTLSEHQSPFEALSAEVHNKGQISGDTYGSHIKFLNIKPTYTEGSDGTVVSAQSYVFNDIPSKTTIKIEITKELQDRLHLKTNIIQIISR